MFTKIQQNVLSKVMSAITVFAVMSSIAVPSSVIAAQPVNQCQDSDYVVIAGSPSVNGTEATVSGIATVSADANGANANTIHIGIDWNEDQSAAADKDFVQELSGSEVTITENGDGSFSITWGPVIHDYANAGAGTYTAFAVIYHGNVTGCDGFSGSQVDEISIVIPPQCSDGVDNDGDTMVDASDLGCSGPTDDDESDDPTPPDTTAPVVTVTPDIQTVEATGPSGAVASYVATAVDDTDGTLVPSCNIPSGSTFPLGNTQIVCSATDAALNEGSDTADITVVDTTPPIIVLNGSANIPLNVGDSYAELNATASDIVSGDLTSQIVISGTVNTSIPDSYFLTYDVSDTAGNPATQVVRTVNVSDVSGPLFGPISDVTAEAVDSNGAVVNYPVVNATDDVDGVILASCTPVSGSVFPIGTTQVVCTATDSSNNTSNTSFSVIVEDTTPPVIALLGNETVNLTVGDIYDDAGATANDNIDGDITPQIDTNNPVNTAVAGTYTVTYDVSDAAGNVATQVTRMVIVSEPEVTDVCPNLEGTQNEVPQGYQLVEGQCLLIEVPVDMCPNIEGNQAEIPQGYELVEGQCVLIETPVDLCENIEGVQETVPEGYHVESENQCVLNQVIPPTIAACQDGIDNDNDGMTDWPIDPGCFDANDNDETDPVVTPPGGGGGGGNGPIFGGGGGGGGSVLGASTGPVGQVLGVSIEMCSQYLTSYIHPTRQNDSEQVSRLQRFLRDIEGFSNVSETGIYDSVSIDAVNQFQIRYAGDILSPWGASRPTSYVYYTTQKKINEAVCKFAREFPLSEQQLAEIERVRTQGVTVPASSGTVPTITPSAPSTPAPETTPEVGAAETVETTATVVEADAAPQTGFFKKLWNKLFGN